MFFLGKAILKPSNLMIFGTLLLSLFALVENLDLLNFQKKTSVISREQEKSSNSKQGKFLKYQVSSGQRAYNHSPSIVSLKSGNLLAVWYAGDREGGDKMELRLKEFDRKLRSWKEERVIINKQDIPYLTRRIGNPVIFEHPADQKSLFIIFTSTLFGWSTSYLNLIKSSDGGKNWQFLQRLYLGNFLNFSHLVRCKPTFLEEKKVLIPIYREFINKFGLLLELDLDRSNRLIQSTKKISKLREGIQPSILWQAEQDSLLAFLRNTNETDQTGNLIAKKFDQNFNLKKSFESGIKNRDTPVSIVETNQENQLLIVYTEPNSRELRLGQIDLNQDNKLRVRDLITIEKAASKYPYLVHDTKQKNLIHLVYAKKNQQGKEIKHLSINTSQLERIKDAGVL